MILRSRAGMNINDDAGQRAEGERERAWSMEHGAEVTFYVR